MSQPIDDEKRARVLEAAMAKFSAYGFARTSMADIAGAAGMSRPALYQYYRNKEEIFREMLADVLGTAADKALSALDAEADLPSQLDGFLQRWSGDLTEQFRSTEHGAELVEAKMGHAKPVFETVNRRVRNAVVRRLEAVAGKQAEVLADLLLLSPLGFKYDDPTMPKLRRRLALLAISVAEVAQSPRSGA